MSQRQFKVKRRRVPLRMLATEPMAAPGGTRLRVLEQWQAFSSLVLEEVGPDQKREMRRAFYAGCEAFYRVVMTATDASTPECTDGDLTVMEDIHNELAAFAHDVKEGRA